MEWALNNSAGPSGPKKPPLPDPTKRRDDQPGWTKGLRKLYDSILNEPLPDSFDDLLKKLDKGDDA